MGRRIIKIWEYFIMLYFLFIYFFLYNECFFVLFLDKWILNLYFSHLSRNNFKTYIIRIRFSIQFILIFMNHHRLWSWFTAFVQRNNIIIYYTIYYKLPFKRQRLWHSASEKFYFPLFIVASERKQIHWKIMDNR